MTARRRPTRALASLLALSLIPTLGLIACEDTPTFPTSALDVPIDFSYACEGAGATVAPDNDERALTFAATRSCPDLPDGTEGRMFGVVLNSGNGTLSILQMNPASSGGVESLGILDTNAFIPGVTSIKVGEGVLRVLRAKDWRSFYVVSAGTRDVTRVILERYKDGIVEARTKRFPLPGTPGAAAMMGDTLVISSARSTELWTFDLAAQPEAPPLTTVALPAIIQDMQPLGADLTRLVATWQGRPVVSILGIDGTVEGEAGAVPACSDTLDNDGDGLADALDPDCQGATDFTESGGLAARPASVEPSAFFASPPSCADGLDNDGDGLTDFPWDAACTLATDEEWAPECGDGIDNDGDGKTDDADEACYGSSGLYEVNASVGGPFSATVVDSNAGLFVYVLDASASTLSAFLVPQVGAAVMGLVPIAIPAIEETVPPMDYRLFGDGDPGAAGVLPGSIEALPSTRAAASPGPAFQGETRLFLPEPSLALNASKLRGALWDRLIAPAAAGAAPTVAYNADSAALWTPIGCATDGANTCNQPSVDGENWTVFVPRDDGRIQLVEVVRRGVPVHRLTPARPDPADRTVDIPDRPNLFLRGRAIPVGASLRAGYPFPGPRLEEELDALVVASDGQACTTDADCTDGVCQCTDDACATRLCDANSRPRRFRRFGIWPARDLETMIDETWTVAFEGALPRTASFQGRMIADDTFSDPSASFCSQGVEVGDWLTIRAPADAMAPSLRTIVDLDAGGATPCDLEPATLHEVEVAITAVGQTTLTVDPATARLRPVEPILDDEAILLRDDITVAGCREVRDAQLLELTWPANLTATPDFAASALPKRFAYSVRPNDVWVVSGSRSGYLHPWSWDGAQCVSDATADPRQNGRFAQATLKAGAVYDRCAPSAESLVINAMDSLIEPTNRFDGYGFQMDLFPACRILADASVELVPTQRDTAWRFEVQGPDQGATLSLAQRQLTTAVPAFDTRQQQIVLDAKAQRAVQVQVRPGSAQTILTFE